MNSRKAVQPINTTEGYLIPSQHETLARGLSIFRPANRTFVVLVGVAAAAAAPAAAWPCSSDIASPISLPPPTGPRPFRSRTTWSASASRTSTKTTCTSVSEPAAAAAAAAADQS